MSSLRQQISGLIDTCETIIQGKKSADLPGVDGGTAQHANAILQQAKAEIPDDKILAAVSLPAMDQGLGHWSWTGILAAMNSI
jgi:hypothetical protein